MPKKKPKAIINKAGRITQKSAEVIVGRKRVPTNNTDNGRRLTENLKD